MLKRKSKLFFIVKQDRDVVDYEITVPKKQEMEDFWSGDMEAKGAGEALHLGKRFDSGSFASESTQAPTELDEAWKRADLAKIIGIKIEKNVSP